MMMAELCALNVGRGVWRKAYPLRARPVPHMHGTIDGTIAEDSTQASQVNR